MITVESILANTIISNRPVLVCSQCRIRATDLPSESAQTNKMQRCTRCKVAHYCSITCQKKHYRFHKRTCQFIATEQTAIVDIVKNLHDKQDESMLSLLAHRHIQLGDSLVTMGYRETDTVDNGAPYYRQALQQYCQAAKTLQLLGQNHHQHQHQNQRKHKHKHNVSTNSLEDKSLLLLVVLGGDETTLQDWIVHYSAETSLRKLYYCCDDDDDDSNDNYRNHAKSPNTMKNMESCYLCPPKALDTDDACFHMISLLLAMRRLLHYRNTWKAFHMYQKHANKLVTKILYHEDDARNTAETNGETSASQSTTTTTTTTIQHDANIERTMTTVSDHVLSFVLDQRQMEVLPGIIQRIIDAIRHFDKRDYLVHLRDTIPFSPTEAPYLFVDNDNDDGGGNGIALREFWFLFQDCFFLTPGLNDILHEFVPEEE